MLLQAAAQLAAEGALPVNVRFVVRRRGGDRRPLDRRVPRAGRARRRRVRHLRQRHASHRACRRSTSRRAASLLPRHASARATRDLHSGMYGSAALNAMHALMQRSRRRPAARRPRPGAAARRASRRRPTRSAPAGQQQPSGAEVLREAGATRTTRGPGGVLPPHAGRAVGRRERDPRRQAAACRRPCCRSRRRRTSRSGSRPGQTAKTIAPVVERLLREAAPEGAEVEVERWGLDAPGARARPTRRRSSSRRTPSSGVRHPAGPDRARAARCRSCRRSRTRASRRSSPASPSRRANIHSPERAPARRLPPPRRRHRASSSRRLGDLS